MMNKKEKVTNIFGVKNKLFKKIKPIKVSVCSSIFYFNQAVVLLYLNKLVELVGVAAAFVHVMAQPHFLHLWQSNW